MKFSASAAAVGLVSASSASAFHLPNAELTTCSSSCQNGAESALQTVSSFFFDTKYLTCECDAGFSGSCCEEASPCSEVPVTTVDINISKFASKTWYTQWQQTTQFEPLEALYCVNAAYDFNPQAPGLYTASNNGYLGGVNGKVNSAVACLGESDVPGSLLFAPCPVFNFGAAPFLVIDAGYDSDGEFDWVVVLGGQPTERQELDNRCTTPNGVFALLTRSQDLSDDQALAMARAIKAQGISTTLLRRVQQEGCDYAASFRVKDGVDDGEGPEAPTTFAPVEGTTFAPPPGVFPPGAGGPPADAIEGALPPCFLVEQGILEAGTPCQ